MTTFGELRALSRDGAFGDRKVKRLKICPVILCLAVVLQSVRDALIRSLTIDHFKLMAHALGTDRGGKAYRNHYCATPGTDEDQAWRALVVVGFASVWKEAGPGESFNVYHVTEAGRGALMVRES